ncbi:hypothetical protein BGX20_008467 [Mortierella sp. AD010]|nr:hypothetical protein BGX20_008467 [Mortierella sp. AD010]
MVPFESFDDWSASNSADHAKFLCYETNCGPDDPDDSYFGPLNDPGDGVCFTSFTMPPYLPDDYIVQGGQDLVPKGSRGDQRIWQCGDVSSPGTNVFKYWRSSKIVACSFGNQKPPNPQLDDLLSQSLEPCSRANSFVGKPFGFVGASF